MKIELQVEYDMNLLDDKNYSNTAVKYENLASIEFNNFPARVAHVNRQGLLISVSKNFHSWLNLPPSVFSDRHLENVISTRHDTFLKEAIDNAIEGENGFIDLYYPANSDDLYKICVTPSATGCLVLVLDTNVEPTYQKQNVSYSSPWLQSRNLFFRKIFKHSLKKDSSSEISLVLIQLDQLNELSNAFGSEIVEKLFTQCVDRIKRIVFGTQGNLFERVSYDQMLLLIVDTYWLENIESLILSIQDEIDKHFIVGKQCVSLSANLGISVSKVQENKPEVLFKQAEMALFCAKEEGSNRYCFYTNSLQSSTDRHLKIKHTLKHDLVTGSGFYMVYQPIINMSTKLIVSVEALIRWNHKELGELYPDEFISIAESTGQILELGKFVIKESLKSLKLIQKRKSNFKMSINVSPIQLKERDFSEYLKNQLNKISIEPCTLIIEITESSSLENSIIIQRNLKAINHLGCLLSIDDFGTGYSSFSSLRSSLFSYLKIDKTFISDITKNKQNSSLVKSIVAMSADMHLKVIVEGIEHKDTEQFTQSLSCEYGQGYLFYKPMLIDNLLHRIVQGLTINTDCYN